MSSYRSFFKEYYHLVNSIDKNPFEYSPTVRDFKDELQLFMLSKRWVKRDIEYKIFELYDKYNDEDIAEDLDITISNYRVINNRLTQRLNSQLFYGDTIRTIIEDEEAMLESIEIMKELKTHIDVRVEFDRDIIDKVRKVREDKTEIQDIKTILLLSVINSKEIKEKIQEYDLEAQMLSFIELLRNSDRHKEYAEKYLSIKNKLKECNTIEDFRKCIERELLMW